MFEYVRDEAVCHSQTDALARAYDSTYKITSPKTGAYAHKSNRRKIAEITPTFPLVP